MHRHAQRVCIRASRWCVSIISGPKALHQLYQRRDLLSSKVNAPPDTFSLILRAGTSIRQVIVGFCLFLRWARLFVCCLCLLRLASRHCSNLMMWLLERRSQHADGRKGKWRPLVISRKEKWLCSHSTLWRALIPDTCNQSQVDLHLAGITSEPPGGGKQHFLFSGNNLSSRLMSSSLLC